MAQYTKYFDNCLAVFQGGGCKAVAYVGAYKAARGRGVVFNELAGTSAGAIVAAFIAAGATPEQLENIVRGEDFMRFCRKPKFARIQMLIFVLLTFPLSIFLIPIDLIAAMKNRTKMRITKMYFYNIIRHWGLYSMRTLEQFIDENLQEFLYGKKSKKQSYNPAKVVKFSDIVPVLHVVSADLGIGRAVVWNKTNSPDMSIAHAVCASCAIPFFFRPIDKKYVDGGIVSNSPDFLFAGKLNYNKILSFRLSTQGNQEVRIRNVFAYVKRIVATIIDGALSIQSGFGISIADVNIPIRDIEATDFDKLDDNMISTLIKAGEESTNSFFEEKEANYSPLKVNTLNKALNSEEQMLSLVASYSAFTKVTKVVVSIPDTKWSWFLFPTILGWVKNKAQIVVYCKKELKISEEELSRRRFLASIGVQLYPQGGNLSLKGIFLWDQVQWLGVVYDIINQKFVGCYYDHIIDGKAIQAWIDKLKVDKRKGLLKNVSLNKEDISKVVDKLRIMDVYKSAQFPSSLEHFSIENIRFLSPHIRLEKYRQINNLFELYKENNLSLFEPASLRLLNDKTSLLAPIVLEEHDGLLYVIEGKTRIVYAYYHGMIDDLKALVIRGELDRLPVPDGYHGETIKQLLITDEKKDINQEYVSLFRHIEYHVRPHSEYLNDIAEDDVNKCID